MQRNLDDIAPTAGEAAAPPAASEVIAACEAAWRAIQGNHPEVPEAVIVLGTGVDRGRLVKLGHWWGGRWIADGEVRGEVLLAGEALHLPPDAVFEVLLHEAAHGLNAARRVQDASRGGRYHNTRFKATAEDLGLVVSAMPPYGWANTSIGPAVRERYELEIARMGTAMRIARRVAADVRLGTDNRQSIGEDAGDRGGSPERNTKAPAVCACGRRMRMAPSVLAQGPVVCGLCGHEFSIGQTHESEPGRTPPSEQGAARVGERNGVAEFADEHAHVGAKEVGLLAFLRDTRELTTTQQVGLATLVELAESSDGALLLAEAGAWYGASRTGEERPLLGNTDAQVELSNRAARALLKLDGTLRGPAAVVRDRELMAGELVMLSASSAEPVDVAGVELPPAGVFGTVEHVDGDRGEITIDFAITGRQTIAIESQAAAGLEYAYSEEVALAGAPLIDLRALPPLPIPNDVAPAIELTL